MIAFKIMSFPHVGSLTFCRIYSGKLDKGMALAQTTRDKKERVGMVYEMHADKRNAVDSAYAGDIVALAGLKDTRTGETLSDANKPVLLEKMEFPNPVIEMSVEPKTKGDNEKMATVLHMLALEDPSFRVSVDQESGQTILKGMGELHLDIKVDIMRREPHNIEVNVGAPQVAYRETLAKAVDIDYTHKKQTGGTGQFARVKMKLEPNEIGGGNVFEASIVGGTVPKEYIPGVEKGVNSVWDNGVLIGFPIVDMKVTLHDGAYHEVDSSAIAFEIASRAAMKEGCDRAGIKLLEPIMDVEVVSPGDFVGGVIGDINSRRGQIRDQQMRGNATVIRANVPLANMFGYVSQLRSMSQGRASYTMQFAHYAEVPRNVAEEVKAKYA
jgi:elongation factor G